MRKIIKFIILFLILVLPVLTYLFLKGFGENKFVIPTYHQEPLAEGIPGCFEMEYPHQVRLDRYGVSLDDFSGMVLVNPVLDDCFDCAPNLNEIKRVSQKYPNLPVLNFMDAQLTILSGEQNKLPSNWFVNQVTLPDLISFLRCELLFELPQKTSLTKMNAQNQLVLLDGKGRIRGYYKKNNREEIDRLITEINILELENEGRDQ